ncbi:hypothetical protein F7725_020392 [Dissostichus mawsoni]|uniref:Uncharacterized protein n=1 Tax=Dissostichus mawsoni TaxID=36200 RepID=A0A7J5YD29_DISMA|nr:hypothetical protein F7725_020392 [Dissostichus mawsoni]
MFLSSVGSVLLSLRGRLPKRYFLHKCNSVFRGPKQSNGSRIASDPPASPSLPPGSPCPTARVGLLTRVFPPSASCCGPCQVSSGEGRSAAGQEELREESCSPASCCPNMGASLCHLANQTAGCVPPKDAMVPGQA